MGVADLFGTFLWPVQIGGYIHPWFAQSFYSTYELVLHHFVKYTNKPFKRIGVSGMAIAIVTSMTYTCALIKFELRSLCRFLVESCGGHHIYLDL